MAQAGELTHRGKAIREIGSLERYERPLPVVLIGECGTGKTHLATGLCVAACRQKRRVRFTTAANLVNELVEASQHHGVRRVLARWMRYDVIALDEVGYVPLAEIGAEFLFQVIAERAERATLIVTTNLPFSEWTQVFPNPRLCKALLDRVTDRAHIIETGTESYRFRRTVEGRQKKKDPIGRAASERLHQSFKSRPPVLSHGSRGGLLGFLGRFLASRKGAIGTGKIESMMKFDASEIGKYASTVPPINHIPLAPAKKQTARLKSRTAANIDASYHRAVWNSPPQLAHVQGLPARYPVFGRKAPQAGHLYFGLCSPI